MAKSTNLLVEFKKEELSTQDPDAAERAISAHVDSIFKPTFMMQNNNVE